MMQSAAHTRQSSVAGEMVSPEGERLREAMEEAAHAISHDLQAPLRHILSESEELSRHAGLDDTVRAEVQALASEAARLKTMMQAMVDFLRLETFTPAYAVLDANELLASALAMLQDKIEASGARITQEALPQVRGHRGRLTRLLAYLVDNALTFHGEQPPVIHISARKAGGICEFCIEDKGIGVDGAHRRIIFRLFQRLHTDAYPGEGVGLALSRKIVESHGGSLWVDTAPQGGSRFYFTLPEA